MMMIRRLSARVPLLKESVYLFSGGHHAKPFDWRDDHVLNPSFEQNPRRIGIPDPLEYTYPHTQAPDPKPKYTPDNYDPKNLSQNWFGPFVPDGVPVRNLLDAPQQNLMHDIEHEFEYESEDFDFQPESFKTQHFRKKGFIGQWLFAMTAWAWMMYVEFIYLAPFGTEPFHYQRPPPLNYPDQEDTPDYETVAIFKTQQYQYLWDAGQVADPFMDVVDGKKIYSKWAGVNDPNVVIRKDW